MIGLAETAELLLSVHGVRDGEFRRLRSALPADLRPDGPTVRVFEGMPNTGGAGMAVDLMAHHPDGRMLVWIVEVWIDRHPDGDWWATVKGEIDLDGDDGDDYCVLNEQRTVDTARQASDAVRELAAAVAGYPLPDLLAKRWLPGEHDDYGDTTVTAQP